MNPATEKKILSNACKTRWLLTHYLGILKVSFSLKHPDEGIKTLKSKYLIVIKACGKLLDGESKWKILHMKNY
ncbi:unnamed protein product [Blepharisma stoltei]|uniref:Uncharacterized protein n=1 Tax=Blepharisma stoltei TaxID=1481888 RepID=A0AAU9JAC3_9CILI|nr:unnamed protein product [Blepharisma stoltei]